MDKFITIEQIKNNPNLDLSERMNAYGNEEIALASIKREYEYFASNRTNISPRTDDMLMQVLNGHILDKSETFEMICDDPKKVEQYTKYENLKQKINDNNGITIEDFDDLCNTMGLDSEIKKVMQEEFEKKGLIIAAYKTK